MKTPLARTFGILVSVAGLTSSCPAQPAPDAKNTPATKMEKKLETATLGAGCYWCIEAVLQRIKGVEKVVSGFMGGEVKNPTYEQVCEGNSGHAEVVQVQFDPEVIPYKKLLEVFWECHDPTTPNRQGHDVGTQYRSAIFYHSDGQKAAAEESKKKAQPKFSSPIVTEISKASEFYAAPGPHQDYYNRNKDRNPYCRVVIWPKLKKLGIDSK
ncbi:MAG: peptide-methionine (S)-S-oxide reductase MsrA [Verrucomicrobiales bacterium]